ncbi:MAG: hypothetical protein GY726_07890 [Proteobacteria bacterium]|nr:hypothetical protein [Pseudomonadota bacterium]
MKAVIRLAFRVAFGSLRAWFAILLLASHSASALDINWDTVTNMSAGGQDAYYPQIALSSNGTMATAVWFRKDGSNWIVQSRSATISGNTATWGAVTTELSASGQDAGDPQIALSSNGTMATAVWYRKDGSNFVVQSRSATISGNTATWGAVTTELSAGGQDAYDPQIALSSDGTKATAVWKRSNGSNVIIQSRSATISGNTATWGAVTTDLSASGPNLHAYEPQIALSSNGTMATAVWYRHDSSNYEIIQSRSATISGNTATWGAVTTELSAGGQHANDPQIALSSDGTRATAVWYRDDSSNYAIIQSRSATISGNTATWSAVTTELSASGQDAYDPQIALSSNGTKATAVWKRSNGSNKIIQSRSATISGNTATWGALTTELSASGQDAGDPQIALSSNGTMATAVWYRDDGSNEIIQSRSATISGNTATWGDETTALSAGGQKAYYLQIALSSDGTRATAVWSRANSSNDIIQSRSATISDCSFFVIKTSAGKGATFCL